MKRIKKATIIGIAGGSASGKTTIAKKLYDATKLKGSVLYLKMDEVSPKENYKASLRYMK